MIQPDNYHDPDWALVRRMADGDMQALDDLYGLHGPAILGFLMARLNDRQLAEEVLQDVMLAAWEHASSFRAESKVKTWLLVIARNQAINTQRKRRLKLVELHEEADYISDDTGPSERINVRVDQMLVRDALEQLPQHQREVLILTFYHQLTGPEIAEVLDVSVGTIKSRLHRAKEMLRRVLIQEDEL